jgi:hypothetical protein
MAVACRAASSRRGAPASGAKKSLMLSVQMPNPVTCSRADAVATIVIGDGKANVMPLAMLDEVDAAGVLDQPSNDTPIAELAAMNARL